MSVRTAVTLVGAAIGAAFGMPQLGFVIGSLVGGIVDPVKTEGPRLNDAKIQTARDGVPIVWGAGRFRTAGTLICVQPGGPTEHKHKDSGKGGGTQTTTYTYTQTHAILVCKGPIIGIARIWRDQKLVYDHGALTPDLQAMWDADPGGTFALAWSGGLASSSDFAQKMTIYLGDETQLPDADLEAIFGAGEVNAHRGYAYVVFKDDDVTDRAGSISNYEFEVVKAGTLAPYSAFPELLAANTDWYTFDNTAVSSVSGHFWSNANNGSGMVSYPTGTKSEEGEASMPFAAGNFSSTPSGTDFSWCGWVHVNAAVLSTSIYGFGEAVSFSSGNLQGFVIHTDGAGNTTGYVFAYDAGAGPAYVNSTPTAIVDADDRIFCVLTMDGANKTYRLWANNVLIGTYVMATYPLTAYMERVIWHNQETSTLGTMPQHLDEVGIFYDLALTSQHRDYLWNGGSGRSYAEFLSGAGGSASGDPGAAGWQLVDGVWVNTGAQVNLISADQVTLASFLLDVTERSGLTAADIDTSALSDNIDGFLVARSTNGAAVVSVLSQGFFFDSAEVDGKIHFVPRGGSSAASLDVDDLVALDGPPVEEVRDQEIERPRKLNVVYFDPDLAYIASKQTGERRSATVSAVGEATIELPIVFDKDAAAQVADRAIKVMWTDLLGTVSFSLPDEFSYLVPTDVVTLTYRGRAMRIRIEKIDEENGVLMIVGRQDRQSAYVSTVTGQGTPQSPNYPVPGGATVFAAMNLPSLRPQDNVPGVYVAACGVTTAWAGCVVQISYDGGATYANALTISAATVMGNLTASCTSSSEPIAVQVYGTMESVSTAQITAGANAFAILTAGDVAEIGQVETVTDNGSGAYDLTDVTRGILGTTAASHADAERFVMLDGVYFLPISSDFAGDTIYFRPVTNGTVADTNAEYSLVFDPGAIVYDGGEIT